MSVSDRSGTKFFRKYCDYSNCNDIIFVISRFDVTVLVLSTAMNEWYNVNIHEHKPVIIFWPLISFQPVFLGNNGISCWNFGRKVLLKMFYVIVL